MNILEKAFLRILYSSLTSIIIVLIVLLIKNIFKNKLSPRFIHALWFLVLIRLLMPFVPESNLSLFNLFPQKTINPASYISFNSKYPTCEIDEGKDELNLRLKYKEENDINTSKLSEENPSRPNKQRLFLKEEGHLIGICSYIWLIGILSMCIFICIAALRFNKESNSFVEISNSNIIRILNVCKEKLSLNKKILVYSDSTFEAPFIYGFLNPKIYIPKNILNTVNDQQLLHISLHEMAHYKRKDLFYNLLGIIATIIHWFNPIVWLIMKEMKADREAACDNHVLEILGENESIPYGMTIIKLSQIISNHNHKKILSTSFYENKNQIERRISMIKMFKKGSYKISIISVVLFIVLGATTLTNATSFKDKNKKFELDAPTKRFNSLDRAIDFVDFEFKVPDYIPTGYNFFHINLDENNVIYIDFEKYENNHTSNFSFLVSQDDIIKYLKEQSNVAYEDIESSVKFNTKPMSLSNIEGTNVVIEQTFEWTEDDLKELEKSNTKDIKNVPISETVNKYFAWEDEGIWYALHYYFRTTTLEEEYHLDKLPKKDDVIKIITSLKHTEDIQNDNYIARKSVQDHLCIYDERDLKEAEKIIGFIPKFPLNLPENFVPTSSRTYHSIYEREKDSSISITTTFHLKDSDNPIPKIEFIQTKNTFYYDNLVEQEPSVISKTIDGTKFYTYEKESKDGLEEATKKQCYVWKQEDIIYTAEFIGNIENKEKIVKSLVDEPMF